MELPGATRLEPLELGEQEVAEQVVVAVGRPAADLLDQQVAPRQPLQAVRGARQVRHALGDRRHDPPQHGRSGQEPQVVAIERALELAAQVRRDVAVRARHGGDPAVGGPAAQRERGEVHAGRPALGPREQRPDLVVGQAVTGGGRERGGLVLVEREPVGTDLEQRALGAEPGQRDVGLRAGGERDAEPRRQVVEDHRERVEAGAVHQPVDVIEDQEARLRGMVEARQQARHRRGEHAIARRVGHDPLVPEPVDAGQRGREVGDEDGRVVVGLVEGQPRDRAPLPGRPLREHGGLAVPGRRDERHDRGLRARHERRDDPAAVDDALAGNDGFQLRLEQVGQDRLGGRHHGAHGCGGTAAARRTVNGWPGARSVAS